MKNGTLMNTSIFLQNKSDLPYKHKNCNQDYPYLNCVSYIHRKQTYLEPKSKVFFAHLNATFLYILKHYTAKISYNNVSSLLSVNLCFAE